MEAAASRSPIIRYCIHGGGARSAQESTSITALWGEGRLEGGLGVLKVDFENPVDIGGSSSYDLSYGLGLIMIKEVQKRIHRYRWT